MQEDLLFKGNQPERRIEFAKRTEIPDHPRAVELSSDFLPFFQLSSGEMDPIDGAALWIE